MLYSSIAYHIAPNDMGGPASLPPHPMKFHLEFSRCQGFLNNVMHTAHNIYIYIYIYSYTCNYIYIYICIYIYIYIYDICNNNDISDNINK